MTTENPQERWAAPEPNTAPDFSSLAPPPTTPPVAQPPSPAAPAITPPAVSPQPTKKRSTTLLTILVVLLVGAISGTVGYLVGSRTASDDVQEPASNGGDVNLAAGARETIEMELGVAGKTFVLTAPAGNDVTIVAAEFYSQPNRTWVDPAIAIRGEDGLPIDSNDDYGFKNYDIEDDYGAGLTFVMPSSGKVIVDLTEYERFVGVVPIIVAVGDPTAPAPHEIYQPTR